MSSPTPFPVSDEMIDVLVDGASHDPHAILGPHPHDSGVTVRALRPMAESVTVVSGDTDYPMEHESRGVWRAVLPVADVPDY